jgi:hypothetical protein
MPNEIEIIKSLLDSRLLIPIFLLSLFAQGFCYAILLAGPFVTTDTTYHSLANIDGFRLYSVKTELVPVKINGRPQYPRRIELKHFDSPIVGVAMFLIAMMVDALIMFAALLFFAQFPEGKAWINKKRRKWFN